MISPDEIEVLRDFSVIAEHNDIPFVLIGAGARLVIFDRAHDLQSTRTTTDWDIGVNVNDWETFRRLQDALTVGPEPLFTRGREVHRFRHIKGVAIDIVPFGGVEREDGTIAWPEEDTEMLVLGFREVLSNAVSVDIGEGVIVPAATAPGLAMLKTFAFHERRINDDLHDLYFILDNYDRAGNEDRIFDELSDLLSDGLLEYDDAGAYLLGIDVGRLVSSRTVKKLLEIMTTFLDPFSSDLSPLITRVGDERQEVAERTRIAKKFSTFRAGIEAATKSVEGLFKP